MSVLDYQLIILDYNGRQYNLVICLAKNYHLLCRDGKFLIFNSHDDIIDYQSSNNITISINNCPYYNLNAFDLKFALSPDPDTCQLLLELYDLASIAAQSLNAAFIGDDDDMCDSIYDALCFSCDTDENPDFNKTELDCLQKILSQGKRIILSGLGL